MESNIKTFEDACKALSIDASCVPDFSVFPEAHREAMTAHAKLIIIAWALNGNWTPDWDNDDEYKYYPYFNMENGFVFGGVNDSNTDACAGSRLCFRSREIAEYAGTQFQDLYKAYFVIAKQD